MLDSNTCSQGRVHFGKTLLINTVSRAHRAAIWRYLGRAPIEKHSKQSSRCNTFAMSILFVSRICGTNKFLELQSTSSRQSERSGFQKSPARRGLELPNVPVSRLIRAQCRGKLKRSTLSILFERSPCTAADVTEMCVSTNSATLRWRNIERYTIQTLGIEERTIKFVFQLFYFYS